MCKFYRGASILGLAFMLFPLCIYAQGEPLFKRYPLDSILGVRCYELLCTKGGNAVISSSIGMWKLKGRQIDGPSVSYSGMPGIKNFRSYQAEDSLRAMAEGPDSIFFYATHDNLLFYTYNADQGGIGWPPFLFPPKGEKTDRISSLYIDNVGDLYIGMHRDNFYWIKEGANKKSFKGTKNKIVDSLIVPDKGEKQVLKIILNPNSGVLAFAQDPIDKNRIWLGTSNGLFRYNKRNLKSEKIIAKNETSDFRYTVTHIETDKQSNLWFSTLEKGMGFYNSKKNILEFFIYPKKYSSATTRYPIKTFCVKSDNDFFVAVMDSLPAIFNKTNGVYAFINDSSLRKSADSTTDIKTNNLGNLYIIKGGVLYTCKASSDSILASSIKPDNSLSAPFIRSVSYLYGDEIASINYQPEKLKELNLPYNENSFSVFYDINDLGDAGKIQFAWRIVGEADDWIIMPSLNFDSANMAIIRDLKPGKYLFELKAKVGNEDWRKEEAKMIVTKTPPFWQTLWFWGIVVASLSLIVYVIVKWRVSAARKQEQQKVEHEKELMELEAKALRAQMNPHFIYNCMNSIKSLIQNDEKVKSVDYLATFSKLIRTLFQNSDKRQISLYEEIETCKYYLELEGMRLPGRLNYQFNIDSNIDLKSVMVPALIIQPFIENAIWHGIAPKEKGGNVSISVKKDTDTIICEIDDDGIGRALSQQNKPVSGLFHESKAVRLSEARLGLEKMLNEKDNSIQIIDKYDGDVATGTKVVIQFNLQ
jgi:hypothetical protein